MSRKPDTSAPDTRKQSDNEKDRSREAALDEALEETFPASDPVAVGHSDHAGIPPNHREPSKKSADERGGGA